MEVVLPFFPCDDDDDDDDDISIFPPCMEDASFQRTRYYNVSHDTQSWLWDKVQKKISEKEEQQQPSCYYGVGVSNPLQEDSPFKRLKCNAKENEEIIVPLLAKIDKDRNSGFDIVS